MTDFILTLGCQRSGTTLLAQIIGAHPSAIMIDEDDGLYRWTDVLLGETNPPKPRSSRGAGGSHPVLLQKLSGGLARLYRRLRRVHSLWYPVWWRPGSKTDPDILFRRCCCSAMAKYRRPLTRFLRDGRLRDSIQCVVLKAPNLTFSYDKLPRALPGARVLYLYRDIRAVVSSMLGLQVPVLRHQLQRIFAVPHLATVFPEELLLLRQDDRTVKPHVKMALVAKIKMSLAKQFQDSGFAVVNVKYEQLVANSEDEIPRILEQLGLSQSTVCLHHNDVFRGVGPGGTRRGRPIDRRSERKWRENLTHQQGSEIWDVVGEFMEGLGYTSG